MIDLSNPLHVFLLALAFLGWGALSYYCGEHEDEEEFTTFFFIILAIANCVVVLVSLTGVILDAV